MISRCLCCELCALRSAVEGAITGRGWRFLGGGATECESFPCLTIFK